jgi:hypothetical protein
LLVILEMCPWQAAEWFPTFLLTFHAMIFAGHLRNVSVAGS